MQQQITTIKPAENNTPKNPSTTEVVVEVPIKVPRIGIVGHMLVQNGNSMGVTLPYITYFERFGNVKIINPTAQLLEEDLDLLVLPGGPDVAATRYLNPDKFPNKKDKKANKVHWRTQRPDEQREWFDLNMLPQYIEKRIPIFGICRGHQTLAVHFGSELIQHLNSHTQNTDTNREGLIQSLAYYNTEVVNDLLRVVEGAKQERINVNSMHHQAVKNTPANATVIAYTVESYYHDKNDIKKSCVVS